MVGAIHSARRAASRSIALSGLRADILEEMECDLAIVALRPAADDAPVDPDRRAGVAGAVEQRRAIPTEVPVAIGPAHGRGVESGKERDPRLGRRARLEVIGQHVADPASIEVHLDGSIGARAFLVAPSDQPVHHLMSSRVPGPKTRSHFLTSSARATSTGISAMPSGSQRSIGLQRNWLAIHVPSGRPRPIRPSSARWKKTFWPTLIVASYGLPRERVIFWPRRGSSARQLRGAGLASLANGGQPDRLELLEQRRRVRPDPAAASMAIVRLRSVSATAREAAAWTIGTSSTGTRNSVRRIASMRRTVRSSYISRSIAAGDDADIRALACRKTLGESDAWITTTRGPPRRPSRPGCRQPADAARPPEPGARPARCVVASASSR